MEKRKHKRVAGSGDVSGRMLMVSSLDIRDLSLSGIRFKCSERMTPRSRVQMLVKKEDCQARLPGTVVRSSLKNSVARSGGTAAHYEVAVSFRDMSGTEQKHLRKIIQLLEDD